MEEEIQLQNLWDEQEERKHERERNRERESLGWEERKRQLQIPPPPKYNTLPIYPQVPNQAGMVGAGGFTMSVQPLCYGYPTHASHPLPQVPTAPPAQCVLAPPVAVRCEATAAAAAVPKKTMAPVNLYVIFSSETKIGRKKSVRIKDIDPDELFGGPASDVLKI